ncbi:biotin transporter BioY [Chamaesiphon sp. OTE_75_metabat_556]|jgi:biotin transport system substrate-specific component|uniref:biotin transporter BioY n=1 Tax=Chamaesiphon sp. OTE_75_metabat_556 TaxID=2964692 RepID=UPI00286C96A8|nr:biotin transporter BioY [Chamaesiphon sp. OTE_75_metabat_556]
MSIPRPYIFMWTIVGLLLTIGASFIPVYVTSSPWQWLNVGGVSAYPLGFKCQVGAVLSIGCLGGRTAGALSQATYVLLGAIGLQVFNDGGGLGYLQKPAFGYLLGFIPGAWVCGQLAFRRRFAKSEVRSTPPVEQLGLSCLLGLLTIHAVGILYLVLFQLVNWQSSGEFKLVEAIGTYSIEPFISQLVLGCSATLIAFILRRLMFY